MDTLVRYVRLWGGLAKNCFLRQAEYKVNVVGRLSIEVVWIFMQVMFFKSVFRFVPQLSNWNEAEIWFFLGTLIFVDGLMMMLYFDNLNKFGQIIRLGLLDFYLLYPVSSVFLSLLRFVNFISFINLGFASAILIYAAYFQGLPFAWWQWLIWLVYVLLGTGMIGAMIVLVSSVAFWTTQSSNLSWLFFELYRLSHRPDNLYSLWLRRLLITVFPAAYFVSVPTQLALGKLQNPAWYVAPFLICFLLTWAARATWRRGLQVYEGAMG